MDEILSVSQANALARQVLEEYSVWVHGEVSNASADKYYYKYFSLKDEGATIACVIPSAYLSSLPFKIEDGISVKAYGTLSVFERDGRFQFKVARIEKDGEGDLQAKIEEIKARLQRDGLLDTARKRPIPTIPTRIAVVTSKDSAAWKDFLKIVTARYPNMEILLYDVLVQGDKAPTDIIRALQYINTLDDIDLIVITRGGGSLEDLMAFNDENLAREIAKAKFPVVSAIGHEKDVSISDLVADLRASTPSNAAELITPDSEAIFQGLDIILSKMNKWLENQFKMHRLHLDSIVDRTGISDHRKFLQRYQDELDGLYEKISRHKRMYESYGTLLHELEFKLHASASAYVKENMEKLSRMHYDLEHGAKTLLQRSSQEITNTELKLEMHNPLQILSKGYTIVTNKDGRVIKKVRDAKEGEVISTQFVDGLMKSTILDISYNEKG